MARKPTITPENTLELLLAARAAVASAANRVSAAMEATERNQNNLLEAVSDRAALGERVAQLLDEVRTIKHQRNVAPEAFINAILAKIDERGELEGQMLCFAREKNRKLEQRTAQALRERDSARRQCEQLHEILEQAAMAPRLIDRLRWAFWGARKVKGGENDNQS